MRSYKGTSNAAKGSAGSSQCSTPVENVSKWKIPHYYRKAGSSNSGGNVIPNGEFSGSLNQAGKGHQGASGGNINIMTTPKHVQLDANGKRNTKSKPKKGEMVFVNYTVKDTESHSQSEPPPVAAPVPSTKKKSSKSRMLKIFSAVHGSGGTSQDAHGALTPLDTSDGSNLSEQTLQFNSSSSTPSSQATKRSYSSFLKCGTIGSASTITSPVIAPSEDLVPRSATSRSFNSPRPGLHRSLSSNVALVNNNGKASLTMGPSCSEASLVSKPSPSRERCNPYISAHLDHHYLDQYKDHQGSLTASGAPSHPNSMHASMSPRPGDENDASIAFSKMFPRKRANTGGSMSSLVSGSTSNNPIGLHRNFSTNSISSLANKYSPIRTASPGKNSSVRRSSSHRFSRDFFALHNPSNYATDPSSGMDTYLDAQAKQRQTHKKKQESISDIRGVSTNSSLSSASTPCLFETSQNGNYINNFERQNNTLFSLDRESSLENEILEEQEESSSYSPNRVSAVGYIPKDNLEITDERASDVASLQHTNYSSATMFSSLVNSHSTLESTAPPITFQDQKEFENQNVGNTHPDYEAGGHQEASDYSESQNDDFLNLYMELDLGSRAEFLASQQGKISPYENDGPQHPNTSFQGDVSTLHSMLDDSPATLTHNPVGSNKRDPIEDLQRNEQVPYTSFSHRILHDINQITRSINNEERPNGSTNEWGHSHL
ncbi:LADA_0F04038g1_1 [Lachancea dasiensis]|uniref:LADA_0F04038g1_1 n=1 Tax=Lachancea dasiensis TaxID=1072105 RepID=A0A1G4JJ01_9SACH|nr:LADA_0F04038g1_1 [Lachancea dasiensis]